MASGNDKSAGSAFWSLILTLLLFGPFLYVFGPAVIRILIDMFR